jgi:hypothetical protein
MNAGLWFTEDFKPAVEAAVRRAHTQEYVGFLNEMEKKVAAVVTQAGANAAQMRRKSACCSLNCWRAPRSNRPLGILSILSGIVSDRFRLA